jgi:hypothetical protein
VLKKNGLKNTLDEAIRVALTKKPTGQKVNCCTVL